MRTGVSNLRRFTQSGEEIPPDTSARLSDATTDGVLPPGNYGMNAPLGARITPRGIAQNLPPPVAPLAPAAWRQIGDHLRLNVRWYFPSMKEERNAADAISGTQALNFLSAQRFRIEAALSLDLFAQSGESAFPVETHLATRTLASPDLLVPWARPDFDDIALQ